MEALPLMAGCVRTSEKEQPGKSQRVTSRRLVVTTLVEDTAHEKIGIQQYMSPDQEQCLSTEELVRSFKEVRHTTIQNS